MRQPDLCDGACNHFRLDLWSDFGIVSGRGDCTHVTFDADTSVRVCRQQGQPEFQDCISHFDDGISTKSL